MAAFNASSLSVLTNHLRAMLNLIQSSYHEDVAELNFIQSGSLLIDFNSWKQKKSLELMQALCSSHLDPEDLSLIGQFMSGHVPFDSFFPRKYYTDVLATDADGDSDEDRGIDEASLVRLASEEVEVMRQINELKVAGRWSGEDEELQGLELGNLDNTPSLSSLSPAPEKTERFHCDHMFTELQWLAEDFKRERQWKRTSAKKIALAVMKAFRERTERSMKAEKEEVLRVRRHCALIARMIRDFWRQVDKIVHAKHQARLSVKRQQAITTHLGRVLETTEEYTRWLTEGIGGSASQEKGVTDGPVSECKQLEAYVADSITNQPDFREKKRSKPLRKAQLSAEDSSDDEYEADDKLLEASDDDEETIELEERQARLTGSDTVPSPRAELDQLAADADRPIEDLLPPGYLDFISEQSTSVKNEQTSTSSEDDSYQPEQGSRSDEEMAANDDDDETTIAVEEELEKTERTKDTGEFESDPVREEIAQLEAEASMPIEALLSRIGYDPTSEKNGPRSVGSEEPMDTGSVENEQSDSEHSSAELSSSSVTEGSISLKDLLSEGEDSGHKGTKAEPLSDFRDSCDKIHCIPNSEVDTQQSEELQNLESLTAEAMEAQPTQSTTLSSVGSAISTPFLLSGGTLREYQLVGLGWLAAIYQKRLNGILADEMGLGKTIQTIALLAHLACEHGIWGPHLIVVPTSVILNWEMEFKRWCPGFKIISYFGHAKERKERRKGWTKTNAFHVCITSYRLAIQDASVFKRKKWKYLILDEAQNIKNFKSQRWQTLLTFNSQRRLLLTGTPLQNSLMELWSLMHFLMPNIFQSHRDFQEWFASPLTGMIEGNSEYNEQLVARLHKVLRPFLLRRLKADVERQLPKKFEHVVMCRLSRRQRFLYDDFMSLSSTRDTLTSGQFLSVMNVLMQLRKVCNHPNLFETRPILSPFHIDDGLLTCPLPRLLSSQSHPFLVLAPVPTNQASPCSNASAFNDPDLDWLDRAGAAARLLGQATNLAEMARDLPTFVHRRCRELCPRTDLFMAVDSIDVVDEVKNQRKSLSEHAQRVGSSPFFSADVIKVVDEERRRTSSFYIPSLRDPLPIQPVVVEAEASARPCNVGMPKSIIRHRANERRARLALLARINSRRCGLVETKQIRAPQSVEMFDFGTPLGPDLFEVVRRMCSDQSPAHRTVYPGLIDGRRRCQQSLLYWPSQCYLQRRITKCSPIDQAGCLTGAPLKVSSPYLWTDDCTPLRMLLSSPADYLSHLEDILNRFSFVIPPVTSRGPLPHLMCPKYQRQVRHQSDRIEELLRSSVVPSIPQQSIPTRHGGRSSLSTVSVSSLAWLLPTQLHQIATACRIQFPDPRLIQYDCGKLQRLDLLLRELKAGSHRVLIFTQMARMLDILEQFLAYHGHRYLRLDGTTKVEQRQVLMERFNQDNQIFAFILSTRSGGLGVNLTGADTVVFYDSDWNPTMDAQAQDRCHRIGQTRDVHIYRLISERTVEENILRKANQKRFLSDVAIEGGRFTTAFFKQNTITELFAEPTGLQDLVTQKETAPSEPSSPPSPVSTPDTSAQPVVVTRSGRQVRPRGDPSVLAALAPSQVAPGTLPDENQLTALLEACEDENDRMAAERALAEAKADLAEFDETIPLEPAVEAPATDAAKENEPDPFVQFAMKRRQNLQTEATEAAKTEVEESVHVQKDMNKLVEDELAEFESTLRPVERLAVRQLEQQREDSLNEELEMADVLLSESKEAWRLDQMKALHMADEEKAEIEEDDMLYCYGAYDPEAQQKAELERLEKLIAEEEAALQSSSRARKRKAVGTRSTERAETPSDREAAPAKDDDVNPPPSVTENDYVGHPRTRKDTTDRLAKRSLYVDASSSDSCSSVSSSDTEVFIPRRGRPPLDKGRLQRFEDHSIPKQKTVKTKQSASSTTSSERDKDFFSKRKAHPSPDITASKVPRIDTTFRSMISRRGRPRKSAMIPNVFDRSRRPLPSLRHDQLDTPEMVEQTARVQSDVIVLPDRVTFDNKAHPNQFRFGKRHPHILRHPSATSTASPSVTGNYPFGQTQPIHRNFTVFQRAPHPSNEPPASIAKPPEPLIPVQSVVNGMRSSVPAGQLFTPTGQPVFVITRQLKTPNGKIYQQRFTHPVIPPPQFAHAVQRLTHPIKSQPVRTLLPVTSQPTLVSGHSVVRVASIPRPTISPLTIPLRLNTVSPGATLTNGIQGQPAGYGSSIATSSTAQQTNIRVSPVVRVWSSGSNTMPSQTQSSTNVVARPRIQVLDNLVDHAVSKLRVIYPKQTKHDTS